MFIVVYFVIDSVRKLLDTHYGLLCSVLYLYSAYCLNENK